MQHLRLERGCFRTASGDPVYLIGANFWPKSTGPFMYRAAWNPAAIGRDLDELAALGANAARIFCFWPDFMPAPDSVSVAALDRLEQTVELCAKRGMWSIPTLFVGHMSGENWPPPWADGGDYYADEPLLLAQELLARTVCAKYKEDPRIAAWLVTNEWPIFAGSTPEDRGIAWARRVCAAMRQVDASHAISLGDGAWDLAWGNETGLPARRLKDVIDFFGPHFYPKESDPARQSLVASFCMRMSAPLGKPVLMEEFGCSSDQAYDPNAADYYRTSLWSAFGAGNCGALAWNSHDFDELARQRPYSHHPYELHFGLIRVDGSRKPQAEEFARFARYAARHSADDWRPQEPSVAIGRTSYFLEAFPFDWGWTKPELRDLYLQTYALCAQAGFEARFVDLEKLEQGPRPWDEDSIKLLIVPCLQQVTTGDAERLESFVRGGGTAYVSYGGEPWYPDLGRLIGARPLIRCGLVEAPMRATLALKFVEPFGSAHTGDVLPIPIRGELRRTAYLPCEPEASAVIAVDDSGRPALLRRRMGAGSVVFCAYPLEYYLMHGTNPNAGSDTWRVYEALSHAAGAFESPAAPSSGLQSFTWTSRHRAQRRRVLLVNHNEKAVSVRFHPALEVADAESGAGVKHASALELGPKEVRVLEVTAPA